MIMVALGGISRDGGLNGLDRRGGIWMFLHVSSGLEFFCTERDPTPDDPDSWDCYGVDAQADDKAVLEEAAEAGITLYAYVDYLARISVESVDKSKRKQFRPSFSKIASPQEIAREVYRARLQIPTSQIPSSPNLMLRQSLLEERSYTLTDINTQVARAA